MTFDALTIALFATTAISATLLFLGLILQLFGERIRTGQRLRTHVKDEAQASFDDLEIEKAIRKAREQQGLKGSLLSTLGRVFSIVPLKDSYLSKQKLYLLQAGLLIRPQELLGIKALSGVVLGLLILLLTRRWYLALPVFFIGWLIPGLTVSSIRRRRAQQLNAQLPEALSIIANGIRAGFSFPQSIQLVTKELDDPIGEEFSKLLHENSLGKSMEEALQNLSDRTIDEDLDIFITALLIQRQVGGNLAEILDTISDTIRERVRLKGEVKTLTAQGRLSAIVVSIMPFALAIAIQTLNPGYMQILYESPLGMVMIGAALLLMGLGILVMRRIIDIKV